MPAFRLATVFSAAIAACTLSAPRPLLADPTPSLALEPAPAGDRAFTLQRAAVRGHLLPSARIAVDYANEPFVIKNFAEEVDTAVSHQIWAHALASFSAAHRFKFHLDVPFVLSQESGPTPASGTTVPRPGTGADFGDLRLGGRAQILGPEEDTGEGFYLGLAGWLWLPTATEGYTGDGVFRMSAALIAEGVSRRLYWAFNGGLRSRPSERFQSRLPHHTGASIALGLAGGFFADSKQQIAIGTELSSDFTFSGEARFFDPRDTVAHWLLTGHYRIVGGPLEVGAAAGPGIGQGPGSAAYRVLALIGYAPERAPPLPDHDGDGIPDKLDACIAVAGVPSTNPRLHGCPPAPRDRDGDAITDDYDACPTLPGVPTGVRKTHGCPKPADTDGDRVADRDDACPREPGEPPPGGNGCPKPAPPPTAELVQERIVISHQVQFETGTAALRPESDAVLGEVLRVLREHPELELVEVQGHTDETGPLDLNRRLGQQRAESVVAWLSGRGIARERLLPKGYGLDRPLADNATEEGRSKNRRVEFRVLRTKPSALPSTPPAEDPKEGGAK